MTKAIKTITLDITGTKAGQQAKAGAIFKTHRKGLGNYPVVMDVEKSMEGAKEALRKYNFTGNEPDNSSQGGKKMEMEKEIRKAIEAKHNVWLSEDGEYYKVCASDPDADPYGWQPVPEEWIREAEGV